MHITDGVVKALGAEVLAGDKKVREKVLKQPAGRAEEGASRGRFMA